MSPRLGSYTDGRDNNFNLIRFVAAAMVLYSHCYPLTGNTALEPLASTAGFSFGHLAVNIFFVTSGFLVTGSLIDRKNAVTYLIARAARIFPALIVAVLFCVLIVGLAFTTLSASDYLLNVRTKAYLVHNISLLYGPIQYQLAGVFETHHLRGVNFSLWTLPWEVKMYLLLLVFWLITIKRSQYLKFISAAAAGLCLVAYFLFLHEPFTDTRETRDGLRFVSVFFIGSFLFLVKNKVAMNGWLCIAITTALITLFIGGYRPALFIAYTILLPYVVLYLAYAPGGILRQFNRLGDYSYGTYIYAFPVQQSIIALWPSIKPLQLLVTALPCTLLLAVLSWHFIESPALRYFRNR